MVSLFQTTTEQGKRSSTYHAFLEGEVEKRPNLTVITGAQATRVLFAGEPGTLRATGVEYVTADGTREVIEAGKRGDPQRRRGRVAAAAHAVGCRAARAPGVARRSLPGRLRPRWAGI